MAPRALGASARLVASAEDLSGVNTVHDVFGQSKHLVKRLVAKYGSEQAAYNALQEAVIEEIPRQMAKVRANDVLEKVQVVVGGQRLLVNGRIMDGVVRVSTAWPK
jgi:hypothetical protein